jgi:hypothetical protein
MENPDITSLMDITPDVHRRRLEANRSNQVPNILSSFFELPDNCMPGEIFFGNKTSQEVFGTGALTDNHHEGMYDFCLASEMNDNVTIDYPAWNSNFECFAPYSTSSELPTLLQAQNTIVAVNDSSNTTTTPAGKVSLKPPSSRNGNGLQSPPRTRARQLTHRNGVQGNVIQKRQATSGRSHLMKALNHLESVKKSLEHHKHFLSVVNRLEESILQHMMTDHRNASAKAGLGSWDSDSAYQSMSQASTTEETESLNTLFELDFGCSSNSSDATEDLQASNQPDLIEITTDMETPRPPRSDIVYHCVFQKPGETCAYSTTRKPDFIRHAESEKHLPQKRYMCILCVNSLERGTSLCPFCSASLNRSGNNKAHYLQCKAAQQGKHIFTGARKTHFTDHLKKCHGAANLGEEQLSWNFAAGSDWPNDCGFCDDTQFPSWQDRTNHIVAHFKARKDISDWKIPSNRKGKGKGKAPRDERPRFDYKKWDDNDDDDGNDSNHFGGSGIGHKSGFAFTSSGSSGSSQPQSSEYGSQDWTPFNYLQASTRMFDSRIKVVDYLKDQLIAEQLSTGKVRHQIDGRYDSDSDTKADMVDNDHRDSMVIQDRHEGHWSPQIQATQPSRRSKLRRARLPKSAIADDKFSILSRPQLKPPPLDSSSDLPVKYAPITGRITRAKKNIPTYTCDVCPKVCSGIPKEALILLTFLVQKFTRGAILR